MHLVGYYIQWFCEYALVFYVVLKRNLVFKILIFSKLKAYSYILYIFKVKCSTFRAQYDLPNLLQTILAVALLNRIRNERDYKCVDHLHSWIATAKHVSRTYANSRAYAENLAVQYNIHLRNQS